MSVFTTADRDAVKVALITAATSGIAEVSVGGQSVRAYNVEQLQGLLQMIQQDLAADNPLGGMRIVKTIPPGAG